MKRIAILGATGSIGTNAVRVVTDHPDRFRVFLLAAHRGWEKLAEQARLLRPDHVALADREAAGRLREALGPDGPPVHGGMDAIVDLVGAPEVDVVLAAIAGAAGLRSSLRAIERGKVLALANKEAMVMAGDILMPLARTTGARIVPVDSEHSAIFQALQSGRRDEVRKVLLTASGGPFLNTPVEQLPGVTVEQALKHPNWSMGGKITIDSATMFNKALEIIEARYLFELRADQIEVVIHPQSIIHSMVEFRDGSTIAQLGWPDMRVPIQYGLTWPERWSGTMPAYDFLQPRTLTFLPPDRAKFRSLDLGFRAAREGGTLGAVLNAANEEAVRWFFERKIRFTDITDLVSRVMDRHHVQPSPTLEDVLAADRWAREEIARCMPSSAA